MHMERVVPHGNGHSLGKPVLICILACSLAFYAITFECSTFTKMASFKIKR